MHYKESMLSSRAIISNHTFDGLVKNTQQSLLALDDLLHPHSSSRPYTERCIQVVTDTASLPHTAGLRAAGTSPVACPGVPTPVATQQIEGGSFTSLKNKALAVTVWRQNIC